jgi:predicted MFS family arabinose efflux permease
MFDKRSAIVASIAVAMVGWAVFMGLPILVGALVDFRGFTEEQVGYLASADLGGMFISSIIVFLFIAKMDRRLWVTIGIAVAIAADVFAIYTYDFSAMMWIRIVAGIGAGFCYSIALANLAATTETTRNFSFLIFTFVAVNFLELYSLKIISNHWGVSGIFVTFIIINLICLMAWPFLPRGKVADEHVHSKSEAEYAFATGHTVEATHAPSHSYNLVLLGTLCLAAIACFYIMIGAFWAYIERMGVTAGFDDNFIAAALSITTLLSAVGCFVAYKISRKQGQSKPLLAAPVLIAVLLVWLGMHTVAFTFVAVLMIYSLLWNGVDIFQLGTISNIDHSGRFIALVPAAQGLGQTIGPSLAGYMVGLGFGYDAIMNLCATAAIATSLIYAFVYWDLKRKAPDLADAS